MTLKKYHQKRNFKKTPEPKGKVISHRAKQLYVIQKHAASHLHYDLRLEMDGVLKSWAVPKGPSLDPTVKRLAVHVEDHPIDYGNFEGIIPAGQYGAGIVMLWDKGEWIIQDINASEAYKKGHMSFILKGKKLQGLWNLIRLKTDPKNWLLIKSDDEYARPENSYDITKSEPLSVLSHQTLEGIAEHHSFKKKVKSLHKKNVLGKKAKMPSSISPQLTTYVDNPPRGDRWLHEIKFDGYRLICFVVNRKIKFMTRGHKDWTNKFPILLEEIQKFKFSNAIFDGEVVAVNDKHEFDFQLLQNTIHLKNDSGLIYYIFDLVYYDGNDLSDVPLLDRKQLLNEILSSFSSPYIQFSDHVIGDGEAVFKKACQFNLEGIISKEIDSHYVQKRTGNWLKSKCKKRQEFVVAGFTKPRGQRSYFGSLLLGVFSKDGKLQYSGHVGTGFTEQTLKSIAELLQKYKTSKMPFAIRPPEVKNVTWIKPRIVVEVEFSGWTNRNILRMPSFKGIREDNLPKKVAMETPHPTNKTEFSYPLTNP